MCRRRRRRWRPRSQQSRQSRQSRRQRTLTRTATRASPAGGPGSASATRATTCGACCGTPSSGRAPPPGASTGTGGPCTMLVAVQHMGHSGAPCGDVQHGQDYTLATCFNHSLSACCCARNQARATAALTHSCHAAGPRSGSAVCGTRRRLRWSLVWRVALARSHHRLCMGSWPQER